MGRIFKLVGNPENYKDLWENREALDKYLKRLEELMSENEVQESEKKEDLINLKIDKTSDEAQS